MLLRSPSSPTPNSWLRLRHVLGPARILVLSFALLIVVGAFLLCLPQASTQSPLSFVDALFTATSAVCVTGLTVVDTGTTFTLFGQVVILLLIQLGGLGIMTFSTFFVSLLGGRLSLGSRDLLQEAFSQRPMQNLKGLLKTVILATLAIESLGAVILSLRLWQNLPLGTALYHGVFHAVSAFCNAGFALYPDSFTSYQADPLVNLTLTLLIILGGLGFVVIFEIMRWRRHHLIGLSLHTKLVLIVSGLLIFVGTALYLVFEYRNDDIPLHWGTRIWTAYFHSASARTAGYNTVNIGALTDATLFMLVFLMFIGASPGSCGGGIKTTTFAAILALLKSRFRNQEEVNLLYRRLPGEIVSKAVSVTFFSFLPIILFTLLLLITEEGAQSHLQAKGEFLELLFEATSAFGTVGLSTGITPTLTEAGRILITLLMFIGRLGPVTVAIAVGGEQRARFKYAQENILIG